MKNIIENRNGKHTCSKVIFPDAINFVSGKYDLHYPVFPNYNLGSAKDNKSMFVLEFSTHVIVKNYYVPYLFRIAVRELNSFVLQSMSIRFDEEVKRFSENVIPLQLLKLETVNFQNKN